MTRNLRRLRGTAALAAALYAVLALGFVSPALLPGKTLSASDFLWDSVPWEAKKPESVQFGGSNNQQADPGVQFLPFMRYTRERLPDAPLWNPHAMLGRPFIGNAQSAVFSPFSTPAYVLPFWRSLALIAALKLFVAAFGTFLLARGLGMRFGGAFLAGCVYAFGMFFVVWLSWPLASVFAWMPWLLWASDLVVRRPGPLPVAGLAAIVAVQFAGGHPESSFHALAGTLAFFAWRLWARRDASAGLARPAVAWAAALLLGTAVAGVAVVPFVESVAESADLSERDNAGFPSIGRQYVLTMALTDYWGRPTQAPRGGFTIEHAFYFGALPLFLALLAVVMRPTAGRLAAAGAATLCVLVAIDTPTLVGHAFRAVPGFAQSHNTRLLIFYLLIAALLAGWGLDDLMSSPNRRRLRPALIALAICAAIPVAAVALSVPVDSDLGTGLAVAWGFDHLTLGDADVPMIRLVAIVAWTILAVAALVLIAARLRGIGPAVFAALAVCLVVIDLWRAGMGWNPAIDIDVARQPETPTLRDLEADAPRRFVGLLAAEHNPPVPSNTGMNFGLYDARGYDYPVEQRYNDFWKRYVAANALFRPITTAAASHEPALRALSMLGVSKVVQDPADPMLHAPGLRLVRPGPDARVYENAAALPRAWIVARQRVAASPELALRAIGDSEFEPRRTAVVERRLEDIGYGGGGSARIVEYEPERVAIDALSRGPGVLVLSDLYYPGWKAEVDGKEVDIERVDYLLRGVPLADGRHTVEFRYEPASWRIGWILSLIGLAAVGGLVAVGVRQRRRA